jgi:hypothetical protein
MSLATVPCFSGSALSSRGSHSVRGSVRVTHDWLYISSQLLVNYNNQSVEGLALPFLANWFLGEFTLFKKNIQETELFLKQGTLPTSSVRSPRHVYTAPPTDCSLQDVF